MHVNYFIYTGKLLQVRVNIECFFNITKDVSFQNKDCLCWCGFVSVKPNCMKYITIFCTFSAPSKIKIDLYNIDNNACTLVPTVFRWHKKMEFKFHFYFSFFFGLEKWNSISISIFHFLCTCDIEKRI